MEIKLFEVRDRGTFMPVMAIAIKEARVRKEITEIEMAEEWLLGRAGFSADTHCIYLVDLEGQEAKYDPYEWTRSRTMGHAHRYIEEHFDSLVSGSLIDVEFILKEKPEPKTSERFEL